MTEFSVTVSSSNRGLAASFAGAGAISTGRRRWRRQLSRRRRHRSLSGHRRRVRRSRVEPERRKRPRVDSPSVAGERSLPAAPNRWIWTWPRARSPVAARPVQQAPGIVGRWRHAGRGHRGRRSRRRALPRRAPVRSRASPETRRRRPQRCSQLQRRRARALSGTSRSLVSKARTRTGEPGFCLYFRPRVAAGRTSPVTLWPRYNRPDAGHHDWTHPRGWRESRIRDRQYGEYPMRFALRLLLPALVLLGPMQGRASAVTIQELPRIQRQAERRRARRAD